MNPWDEIDSVIRFEMCQRREEGCDLSEIEARVEKGSALRATSSGI